MGSDRSNTPRILPLRDLELHMQGTFKDVKPSSDENLKQLQNLQILQELERSEKREFESLVKLLLNSKSLEATFRRQLLELFTLIKESAILTYERHSLKTGLEAQEELLQKVQTKHMLLREIETKRKTLQR